MQTLEQVKLLADALRAIGEIGVEPGADPMPALIKAQVMAAKALADAGLDSEIPLSSGNLTELRKLRIRNLCTPSAKPKSSRKPPMKRE